MLHLRCPRLDLAISVVAIVISVIALSTPVRHHSRLPDRACGAAK
jgi:hypothetical protein